MSEETDIPEWIKVRVNDICAMLGIEDGWKISISLVDNPGGTLGSDGSVDCDSAYLNASIELASGLEDDERGHRVILHELMHVALSPLFQAAGYAFTSLPEMEQRLARQVYIDIEEQVIQRMTRAFKRRGVW